jgi:hypothetical protein
VPWVLVRAALSTSALARLAWSAQNRCLIQLFFTILVLTVAIAWVVLLWKARPDRRGIAAAGMLVWLLFTGTLAFSGILQRFNHLPPPMGVLVAVAFILTAILAFTPYGTRMIASVSIPLIVGFQVFRVGVEIFLWWGGRTGLVPSQLTFEGRNFDVLTGLTALPMALLFARGTIGRVSVAIWNVAGLGLLFNVMTVAVLSFPTPLQYFAPDTSFVATPPYVWLPTVLVQAAWFLHLILFRQLRKDA